LKAHRHLLTLETLKFLVEFLGDGNAKGAAIRAGIPETYASRYGQWLKKQPIVQRALESDIHERDLRKLRTALAEIEEKMLGCKRILGLED